MKKLFLFLLLLAGTVGAGAQEMQQLPLDSAVRYGKLPNGLTYYVRHNALPADRVCFYIAQRVGSVQELDNQRGLAHFLEHMCFNGTKTFPGNSLIKYCERIGVKFGENLNAYTSTDETVYNIDGVPVADENIDSCLMIIRDWAGGLLLEDEEIDKERSVIHEEWRMVNDAPRRLFTRAMKQLMPGSRYAESMPIGTLEVIDNFKYDELRNYYHKWYHPENQAVIVVGDIDAEKVEARIKALFAELGKSPEAADYVFYEVPNTPQAIYFIDKDKEQRQAVLSFDYKFDAFPVELCNTPSFIFMNTLMGTGVSMLNARYEELAQKDDCPFLYAGVRTGKFLGVAKTKQSLSLTVMPKPGKDVEATEAAFKEIERVRRFGFTATELARMNESIMSSIEKVYDNRDKQKHPFYIQQYVRHFLENHPAISVEMEYDLYKKILPQLHLPMYNEVFKELTASTDSNFVCNATYPDKEGVRIPTEEELKAAIEAAKAAQLEAYVDNVKDEPLIARLPEKGKIKKTKAADFGYTCWTLDNGARIYYRQTDFNNSQVIMSATSFGGKSLLKDSDLLATKLFGGAIGASGIGNFTSTELQKKLAAKQVGINVSLGTVSEGLSGSSTPKDLRTLFELIYLRFQAPLKDVEAYNNLIAYYKTSLENSEKLPNTAFSDSIRATLYGHNKMLGRLTLEELKGADYDEVLRIYADRFKSAGDFDFFFTGAFDVDSLKAYVEQYIAPLPGVKKREKYIDKKYYPVEGVVDNHFTREMEVPQAFLAQVWTGTTPYSLKTAQVVGIFGEILNMRYTKSIREDAGFAYSVNAGASASYGMRDEYSLEVMCPIKPEARDSVLLLIREGIEDIVENGVTEEELAKVKAFKEKSYADQQKNNGYWAGLISAKAIWGRDHQKGYLDAMRSVTSADIQKFAGKVLLKQGNCVTVTMLPE